MHQHSGKNLQSDKSRKLAHVFPDIEYLEKNQHCLEYKSQSLRPGLSGASAFASFGGSRGRRYIEHGAENNV